MDERSIMHGHADSKVKDDKSDLLATLRKPWREGTGGSGTAFLYMNKMLQYFKAGAARLTWSRTSRRTPRTRASTFLNRRASLARGTRQ
jgi:hypothetical protein